MKGKVVLITGASSGIGEYLAYEYARKGASLAIVARREERLRKVEERATEVGSPDVLVLCADVSNFNECRKFVDETINHFGRCICWTIGQLWEADLDCWNYRNSKGVCRFELRFGFSCTFYTVDHLVNNAGIGSMYSVNEGIDITKFAPVMDINFWGSVYPTYFAIPHLKKSKGNIVVSGSSTAFVQTPKSAFYSSLSDSSNQR